MKKNIFFKLMSFCLPILLTSMLSAKVSQPNCLMSPPESHFVLNAYPSKIIDQSKQEEVCKVSKIKNWTQRKPARDQDILLNLEGPSGSGRYWQITIATADRGTSKINHVKCLVTNTVGWRTLQKYPGPLPWLEDVDHDGDSEFILWMSFPLHEYASMAEYGLVAWVYQFKNNQFGLDLDLSRQMAKRIANAYRKPLGQRTERVQKDRDRIASYLENFANQQCELVKNY